MTEERTLRTAAEPLRVERAEEQAIAVAVEQTQPQQGLKCPMCGNDIDGDADYCESCHRYVNTEVCGFCGTSMGAEEMYCHECGNPRGGIVCPMCNTLNDFSFCKVCGTPLTDEARALAESMKGLPDYQLMEHLSRELERLDMEEPYRSDQDILRSRENEKLRERVLMLLGRNQNENWNENENQNENWNENQNENENQNRNENEKRNGNGNGNGNGKKMRSVEELRLLKEEKIRLLTEVLERMAVPTVPSPVKARNYAMAQRPMGVKVAWVCNWKGAIHSSPCGCGKPHLGGKWVILGGEK